MGKGKRRPKGWQPDHNLEHRQPIPKVRPQDVPREREIRLRIPVEMYSFLGHMAQRATAAAGKPVSATETAEILLTDALLTAAESYAAMLDEVAALPADPQLEQLELPFGTQREQEGPSEGAA